MAAEQNSSDTDSQFYLPADTFFPRHADIGLTYDDVTLATLYSDILPRDAVLDTSWEPIADMIKRKAEHSDAEMLVVAHHSKKWWEEALAGSVAKYLVDHSDVNVVVVH